jgi:hypothetical protein
MNLNLFIHLQMAMGSQSATVLAKQRGLSVILILNQQAHLRMFHTHCPRFSLITATASYFATDFYQIVFCIEQFGDFIYAIKSS